jgi:FkbM family methyltransferase
MNPLSLIVESSLRAYSRIAPTERGAYRLARFARSLRSKKTRRGIFRTPFGFTLDLDLDAYPDVAMAYGLFELDTARAIKRTLKPGDHFIDGGANIGYFTLLAAKCVGSTGRVDAFEPQPENRARLMENLRRNAMKTRVNIHAQALSDRQGVATIYRPTNEKNHGIASFYPRVESKADEVATARMDEILANTNPRLIKLDVEGAEPLAIAGMTALLKNSPPPAIIIELNTATSAAAGFDPLKPVDMLLAAQPAYRARVIGWRLREFSRDESFEQVNLLFEAR